MTNTRSKNTKRRKKERKMVIYESLGDLFLTTKENYNSPVQNSRLVQNMSRVGFKSVQEIIDYFVDHYNDRESNYIVI